jgi:hypothetical protein
MEKSPENLEICGVCGNPDIDDDQDESCFLKWIQCENCKQWFHQCCLGCDIDTNDFVCSDNCEKNGFSSKKKTNNSNKNNNNNNNNNGKKNINNNIRNMNINSATNKSNKKKNSSNIGKSKNNAKK